MMRRDQPAQFLPPMTLNAGFTHREQIGKGAEGRALLAHLSLRYARADEAEWQRRVEDGEVRLDGELAAAEQLLQIGQWLTWARPPWVEPEVPLEAPILYEDEDLLAVAKPSGLPTLPGGGEFMEHTLLAVVRRHDPAASPMHRLGRGTSGIVLFARSALARREVPELFRSQATRKVYRTLCTGHPVEDAFRIDAPIGPLPHQLLGSLHAATPEGKPSSSLCRVLERREGCSLVEVDLLTGRPHQIRIHLAFAGHPLVGDPLYVFGGRPPEDTCALPGDLGYLLHATLLELPHPRTGAPLSIRCEPPPALATRSYGFPVRE